MNDEDVSPGASPLGEPGGLQEGGCFAGAFEFHFEVVAAPQAGDVGIARDAHGGAVAFAPEEAGVLAGQGFQVTTGGREELGFEGRHKSSKKLQKAAKSCKKLQNA